MEGMRRESGVHTETSPRSMCGSLVKGRHASPYKTTQEPSPGSTDRLGTLVPGNSEDERSWISGNMEVHCKSLSSKALFAEWHLKKFPGNPSATRHQYDQLLGTDSSFLVPMRPALLLGTDGFCLLTLVTVSATLGSELLRESWKMRSRILL